MSAGRAKESSEASSGFADNANASADAAILEPNTKQDKFSSITSPLALTNNILSINFTPTDNLIALKQDSFHVQHLHQL